MSRQRDAPSALRVLAVSDSDSYLKWTVGLLADGTIPWETEIAILRTAITPSKDQRSAALFGRGDLREPQVLGLARLITRTIRERPDVLFLACTGPVVEVITRLIDRALPADARPLYITGLPGLCWPADPKAWGYRLAADVMLTHSERERESFAELGRQLGASAELAVVQLPSLRPDPTPYSSYPASQHRDRVVFAAQAKVPVSRADREKILLHLDRLGGARPELRPVVKLRARAGEFQTHLERLPYDELWEDLLARGEVTRGRIAFETGSMAEQWPTARALVTVSSTAALEAIAADIPVLVLGDFGVNREMLNMTFIGSGCIGRLQDLGEGRFFQPDARWRSRNYFHIGGREWIDLVEQLAARPRVRRKVPPTNSIKVRSLTWRLLLPSWGTPAIRWVRRQQRATLGLVLHRRAEPVDASAQGANHPPDSSAAPHRTPSRGATR
ncbi:MAG: DUF6716 putative glycosyltransferase [Angustibacter sp.]